MVRYIAGRVMDPVLGLATGVFAYYIYETDPRNAQERPPGRTLSDLVQRYWNNQRPPFALYSGPNPLGDRIDRTTTSTARAV